MWWTILCRHSTSQNSVMEEELVALSSKRKLAWKSHKQDQQVEVDEIRWEMRARRVIRIWPVIECIWTRSFLYAGAKFYTVERLFRIFFSYTCAYFTLQHALVFNLSCFRICLLIWSESLKEVLIYSVIMVRMACLDRFRHGKIWRRLEMLIYLFFLYQLNKKL